MLPASAEDHEFLEIRIIVGFEGQIPLRRARNAFGVKSCMCAFVCALVCVSECELFNKLITGLIKKADIYSKAQRSRSWP